MRERFDEMRRMGIRTVMITGDNPLTARAIAAEAGVDDFLAEATPEDKMALIQREQEGGRLVAMTGDGTNDAPALAQADVGVAMNTGTSAAKEAGNMVDLDSNPTKLIEIVEIGKQLLITRGALTTFSIANDVAKYFAIIPAMFVGVYPELDPLNVMQLATPESAILSAVIFNALIIIALIPLALRGVRYTPVRPPPRCSDATWPSTASAASSPLRRHQAHRPGRLPHFPESAERQHPCPPRSSSSVARQVWAAVRMLLVLTVLARPGLPAGADRSSPRRLVPGRRRRLPGLGATAQVVGSSLIGAVLRRPAGVLPARPSAAGDGYDPLAISASNLGPENADLLAADRGAARGRGRARRHRPGRRRAGRPARQRLRSGSRTSARSTPPSRSTAWPRERGLQRRRGARGSWTEHTEGRSWASSASRGSTCWCSTWPSTT